MIPKHDGHEKYRDLLPASVNDLVEGKTSLRLDQTPHVIVAVLEARGVEGRDTEPVLSDAGYPVMVPMDMMNFWGQKVTADFDEQVIRLRNTKLAYLHSAGKGDNSEVSPTEDDYRFDLDHYEELVKFAMFISLPYCTIYHVEGSNYIVRQDLDAHHCDGCSCQEFSEECDEDNCYCGECE